MMWMSNIKDIPCNARLQDLVLAGWPPCWVTLFVVIVVVGPMCLWSIPLAIFTMIKELHGFLFPQPRSQDLYPGYEVAISMHICDPVPMVMGLSLAALGVAGAPLLIWDFFSLGCSLLNPFSSPEPTILLACGRNRELWEQPFRTCAIDEDWVKPDGQNSVISFVISKWLLPELSIPAAD